MNENIVLDPICYEVVSRVKHMNTTLCYVLPLKQLVSLKQRLSSSTVSPLRWKITHYRQNINIVCSACQVHVRISRCPSTKILPHGPCH